MARYQFVGIHLPCALVAAVAAAMQVASTTVQVGDLTALTSALANGGVSVINVDSSIQITSPISLSGRSVTISGTQGNERIELVGTGTRMFNIDGGGTVRFANLIIRNGGNSAFAISGAGTEVWFTGVELANHRFCRGSPNNRCNGGAINARDLAEVHLDRCIVTNNIVTDHGGGIFVDRGARLMITHTNLSLNIGQNRAGGNLAAYNSQITIANSMFSAGRASWRGAGFVFQNTTGTVTDVSVYGNSVNHHHGAGVSIEFYSEVNLTRVNVFDNINDGGNNWRYAAGINIDAATVFMFHCNVHSNLLDGSCGSDANREACEGGGMYIGGHTAPSSVVMEDCNIYNNTASSYAEGGGIFVKTSQVTLRRCNVSGNTVHEERDEGGGIYIQGNAQINIYDSEISDNTAGEGGGLYVQSPARFNLRNVRFSGNRATELPSSSSLLAGALEGPSCNSGQCISGGANGVTCQDCQQYGPRPIGSVTPTSPPSSSLPTSPPFSSAPSQAPSHQPSTSVPTTSVPTSISPSSSSPSRAPSYGPTTVVQTTSTATSVAPSTAPTHTLSTFFMRTPSRIISTSYRTLIVTSTTSVRTIDRSKTSLATIAAETTSSPASERQNEIGQSTTSDQSDSSVIIAVSIAAVVIIGLAVILGVFVVRYTKGGDKIYSGTKSFDNPAYDASTPVDQGAPVYAQPDESSPEVSGYVDMPSSIGVTASGYMDVVPSKGVAASGYMDVVPSQGTMSDFEEDV